MIDDTDLAQLDDADLIAIHARQRWLKQAREPARRGKQIPTFAQGKNIVLWRAGRGFGKTVSVTEFLWWDCWRFPGLIAHMLAPTQADVRGTSFEGPVGFNSIIPAECLHRGTLEKAYNKSTHELLLSNGSKIRGFATTENGERLRGPQCHVMGCDEIAAWDKPAGNLEKAMDNALFGLRLPYPDGSPSRAVMATTPRPIPYLKRFEKRADVQVVTGTSYENIRNLSSTYRNQLLTMQGTAIGRQEIEASYLDDEGSSAIFRRSWMKLWPAGKPLPEFSFIIESYDTAGSEQDYDNKKQQTDPTACLVLGVFNVQAEFDEVTRKRLKIRSRYAALILESWDERLGFPDLMERARKQRSVQWGPKGKGRKSDIVLIEDKSSGRQMRQSLMQYGVPTWAYNPGRSSKTNRAHAMSPIVKQGMLWVPESTRPDRVGLPKDWCEPFLEQVCAFAGPGSTEHDDYVDALTQSLHYLRDRGMLEVTVDEELVDFEERRLRLQAEAEDVYDKEKRERTGNPYAA